MKSIVPNTIDSIDPNFKTNRGIRLWFPYMAYNDPRSDMPKYKKIYVCNKTGLIGRRGVGFTNPNQFTPFSSKVQKAWQDWRNEQAEKILLRGLRDDGY